MCAVEWVHPHIGHPHTRKISVMKIVIKTKLFIKISAFNNRKQVTLKMNFKL